MFKRFVVMCLCASLIGLPACSNEKQFVRPDDTAILANVKPGDEVEITTRNGATYNLEVTEVGDGYLRGKDLDTDKRWRIPFSQVVKLQYSEYSAGKTAAASIGGIAIVWLVLPGIALWIFLAALEDD